MMGPRQLLEPASLLLALLVLVEGVASLQVAIQQQPAQQQQQQQQQLAADGAQASSPPAALIQQPQVEPQAKPPAGAKPNHRLVDKIKDARHRRRHRHHRHRQQVAGQAALLAMGAGEPATSLHSATALTALESIVEEVARAQLPLGAGAIQQQQLAPAPQTNPPQTSSAMSGPDLLLDGSSSPVASIQQAASQQPPVAMGPSQAQPAPLQPTPSVHQSSQHLTRGPLHSTRGFLLTSTLSKIYNLLNVTEFALEMRDGISSRASCVACNAVVGLFLSPLYSKEVFSAAIRTVCTSFKIQSARVCHGLTESFQDDFEYIRKNTKLTRDEVCGVVFGVDCARRQTYNLFWTVPIPEMPIAPGAASNHNSHNHNNNNNLPSSTTSTSSLSIPINEHSLTNMEDAPDLFEYRKSNAAAATSPSSADKQQKQQSQPLSAAASSAPISEIDPNKGPSGAGATSSSAPSSSPQSPPGGQLVMGSSSQSTSGGSQQQMAGSNLKKSAKLLKRPQYIFDDEQLLDNGQPADSGANNNNNRDKQLSSFVHITDIHIDPYYEAGSLNDCNEPLCCRATSGPVAANDRRRQAGRWGDYGNCDVPVRTLRNALERIREQHSNAEYWLWTGDISPHDIWNITKAEAANHVRLVTKLVRDYSNGLPVFPVIGNHEAHPVNSFSPPEIKGKFSMSWLYDLLADEWSEWLPMEALKTLRIGGYYKLQVRKGFRIIALNTNYCARLNPWSFYDPVDPANQLKWLVEELLEAELNQDKVHIIGHVPPDNRECTQAWLFNFINIVDRFRDTILAQFYGHTHRDEWRVIYSLARPEEPIGIQFIGPSITPFTENNPSYRIYHQDKQGHVLDSETYYFNLTEANQTPTSEPNWRFSYSTRAHLNMTQGLNAPDWHQYLQRLHDNDGLFDNFYKNFYRFSDVKSGQVCKNKCKYQLLSDLRLSHPYKTKPKPFLANRKTSNHHRDRHDHHHHHHKRLRHSE